MYLGEKRSFRIRSRSTTVKLEFPFWQALEKIAEAKRISLAALISRVDDEYRNGDGPSPGEKNLASCLRVFCLTSAGKQTNEQGRSLGYG